MKGLKVKTGHLESAKPDISILPKTGHFYFALTNCFTQQVGVLAKLQGIAGQKIVVEHVDVHSGGQAIVGNIHGTGVGESAK